MRSTPPRVLVPLNTPLFADDEIFNRLHDDLLGEQRVRRRTVFGNWRKSYADDRATRRMGILFGGVSDDDKDEETLDSTFYNDLCVSAS